MGGSGGGGLFGGSGRGDRRETPCSLLRITTTLVSPNVEILRTLRIGERLDVVLIAVNPRRLRVAALTSSGVEVGGVLPGQQLPRLIECLQQGQRYIATITDLAPPRCSVEVTAP